MKPLPKTEYTPLIRTDFSDAEAWAAALAAIATPSGDGFLAMVTTLDDPSQYGAGASDMCAAAAHLGYLPLIIIADAVALSAPDFPLLCIEPSSGTSVRVVASELWGIENNLSLANMDFAEFAQAAGPDGVFRGFR